MSKFKVGDRVRFTEDNAFFHGLTGTIQEQDSDINQIKLDKPVDMPITKRGELKRISTVYADDESLILINPSKPDPDWKDIWDSN